MPDLGDSGRGVLYCCVFWTRSDRTDFASASSADSDNWLEVCQDETKVGAHSTIVRASKAVRQGIIVVGTRATVMPKMVRGIFVSPRSEFTTGYQILVRKGSGGSLTAN
jgi:hypothetical protein